MTVWDGMLKARASRGSINSTASLLVNYGPTSKSCGEEWTQLMHELGATPAETSSVLSGRLKALRTNNARWLKLAAKQLLLEVDDLG